MTILRGFLLGIAMCALGACVARSPAHRDALVRHARADPASAYRDYRLLARRYGLPIAHWPDSSLADSLARAGADGPCGPEHTLWVRRLIPVAARHGLDRVIEYDDTRIVREWSTPANDRPLGIVGDALVMALEWFAQDIPVDSSRLPVLYVRPDGSLQVARGAPGRSVASLEDCPRHAMEPRSDFWSCYVFRDLASGKPRRLGFNEVCT